MALTVKICNYDELPSDIKEVLRPDDNSYLLVYHDDMLVRWECASYEPEDVSFWRDLKWVKDALEEVYQLGKDDCTTFH